MYGRQLVLSWLLDWEEIMKKNFLFISCEEAKHICDKVQYNEASGWERFKLGLRLTWCQFTQKYSKQNNKLTESMDKASVEAMTLNEKEELQKSFESELAKYQNQS